MYRYEDLKPQLLTDEGSRQFIRNRDAILRMLNESGAIRLGEATRKMDVSDSFVALATFDRLIEMGEIRELTPAGEIGQHRVFVRTK